MSQKKLYFWEFNCTYVKKIMVAPYFAVCVSTGNGSRLGSGMGSIPFIVIAIISSLHSMCGTGL